MEEYKAMSLFFETAGQARLFLICIPVGFVMTMLLDCKADGGALRFLLDFSVLLLSGCVLLLIMIGSREERLREYHILGIISGGILYLSGIGRIRKQIRPFHSLGHLCAYRAA